MMRKFCVKRWLFHPMARSPFTMLDGGGRFGSIFTIIKDRFLLIDSAQEIFYMAWSGNLGFPPIGSKRETKKALEGFWAGDLSAQQLIDDTAAIRASNWQRQQQAGVDFIPSGEFSLYDRMLDTGVMVGAVAPRFAPLSKSDPLTRYFAQARGFQGTVDGKALDLAALDMTKWFDTNYHYLVPELAEDSQFSLTENIALHSYQAAQKAGLTTRPVLIGPITYLWLAKTRGASQAEVLPRLLDRLLPVYEAALQELAAAGVAWVQIDEPALVLDLPPAIAKLYEATYQRLKKAAGSSKLLLTTYFEGLRENLSLAAHLPVDGLHLDITRAPNEAALLAKLAPANLILSLGIIDGRNIWRADLSAKLTQLEAVAEVVGGERIIVAPSCSLLHSPIDLANESKLDPEIQSWMAFAQQKLVEVVTLTKGLNAGRSAIASELAAADAAIASRRQSKRVHNPAVATEVQSFASKTIARDSAFAKRWQAQQAQLDLPSFPTTTIGSFPQTADVREARQQWRKGALSEAAYEAQLKEKTAEAIRWQEEIDIDVLVHGEFERNDMVEYFGEQLQGYVFSSNGWVQSYGSRYVKPPIIFGDVSRPTPMTLDWATYAQGLTKRPVKGMLTGPVTMLQWSFVRDDQPRADTCRQLALAIRDEVLDLEKAGITIVQIDEPAIREGLPLRAADWQAYLDWAVTSFRLSHYGVKDSTQIHTHMCYSEFNDIMPAIAAMDADVISIETSRSHMELLDAFVDFAYPNQIGPGVYDIHSPRLPNAADMTQLLELAAARLDPAQLWVNPDCGLKTRKWAEVKPALVAMTQAAKSLRSKYEQEEAA
jgi:5-methyltetrahydropteroyltriglutamate--homocysteine methyltransferase